ncbi:MAG: hypothetical protein Q9218_005189 [Villophora microphyllina]
MGLGDYDKFDALITKEIDIISPTLPACNKPAELCKYLQRLSAVRAKLDNCHSKYPTTGMNLLFENLLSDVESLVEKAVGKGFEDEVPTTISINKFQTDYNQISNLTYFGDWSVSITSCAVKRSYWHQDNLKSLLTLNFNSLASDFRIMSDNSTLVHRWDLPEYQKSPIVAISTTGQLNQVRLMPVTEKFNLQAEVLDVTLETAQHAQNLIRRLLRMGCTVVQRPVK